MSWKASRITRLHSDRTSAIGQPIPSFLHSAAYAAAQTYRYARHPMDDVQLRYDPTPRRRQSAGASHQDSLSLSDVVSPPDRPQPRHRECTHGWRCAKNRFTSLPYGLPIRTRQSQFEKRLRYIIGSNQRIQRQLLPGVPDLKQCKGVGGHAAETVCDSQLGRQG